LFLLYKNSVWSNTDKNDFCGEVRTAEKNNVIYMKKVSSGKD